MKILLKLAFLTPILLGCAPLQLAKMAGLPMPTGIGGKNISITLAYDGQIKDESDVAIVVEQSDLKIIQIEGKNTLLSDGSTYRTLWNNRLSTNASLYTHLPPGTYNLTLKYVSPAKSGSSYIGTANYNLTVKAGETIAFIASDVTSSGVFSSKGTFTVSTLDKSSERSTAVADFLILKTK
jgi:hypothetical protein